MGNVKANGRAGAVELCSISRTGSTGRRHASRETIGNYLEGIFVGTESPLLAWVGQKFQEPTQNEVPRAAVADGTDRGSLPSQTGNGEACLREERWLGTQLSSACHPCAPCGYPARTPRFPPDCPFLLRDPAYPIYEIDSCPAESVRFKTEWRVNGPILVNCEIYLSFAGGKVAMQR